MIDRTVLESFDTISLEEMGKVSLMNRIDTKYFTTLDKIDELLKAAAPHYLIQQIDGQTMMPYFTRYYDTEDATMFYQHQRGKKTRQKVRIRKYESSDLPPFIEVKSKNNKGRTRKKRISMDNGAELSPYSDFLETYSDYDPSALIPQIDNHFYRITLVNKEFSERVTIDLGLEFTNLTTGRKVKLNKLGIIECKRDGRAAVSILRDILKDLRIKPNGFSKYCIGMAVTNDGLRQNRLKNKIRMIGRIHPQLTEK